MYYDPEIKSFYESKNGKIYLTLNAINSQIGSLLNLLDNFNSIKIKLMEIIKDIDVIANDIKNNTSNFDIRRKSLFDSWLIDYDISSLLPVGVKASSKALEISTNIDLSLELFTDDIKEYMYNVSLYLKQIFKYINDLKGVSVFR